MRRQEEGRERWEQEEARKQCKLTFKQTDALIAIHVFNGVGHLTFCKLCGLKGRQRRNTHQEQRNPTHHFGCSQTLKCGHRSLHLLLFMKKASGPLATGLHSRKPMTKRCLCQDRNAEPASLPPAFHPPPTSCIQSIPSIVFCP